MITIGRTPRTAAALAALSVNFALAAGLASLAHHYDEQAARELRASGAGQAAAAMATAQAGPLRCKPERVGAG